MIVHNHPWVQSPRVAIAIHELHLGAVAVNKCGTKQQAGHYH